MTLANTANFNATTPGPPTTGQQNIIWQDDGGSPIVNISAINPNMIGDSGSGGKSGNATAPAAGDAAAGKFLKADGTWAVPPGSGSGTFTVEVVSFSGTSGTAANTPINIYGLFRNGVYQRSVGGSPDYTLATATFTLAVAAGGSDVFVLVYTH